MQQIIAQLKNVSGPFDVTFKIAREKRLASRELWSEQETTQLVKESADGRSRADLERIFKRSTGKIFSKIQKHCGMLTKLQALLSAHSEGLDHFELLCKYLAIYSKIGATKHSAKVDAIIPAFLKISGDQLALLNQRVSTKGLTQAEAHQIDVCISIELELHQRKVVVGPPKLREVKGLKKAILPAKQLPISVTENNERISVQSASTPVPKITHPAIDHLELTPCKSEI